MRLTSPAFVTISAALAACDGEGPRSYQGYAEGEYVRIAASFAGALQKLAVQRGVQVKAGDQLFILEQENEAAARREAEERLKNAEAQLANLQKGKRPTELDAIRAQLAQAEASLKLSQARPSMLLSGFMFPFRGMPQWAQWLGEILPLTHFLRVVRGILLKGNGLAEIAPELWPIGLFLLGAATIALLRYRETLD